MIIWFCILINEQPASFPPLSLHCLFILCFNEIAGADNKLCHMMQVIWQVCIMSKANWIWQSSIIIKRFRVIKDFWRLIIIWLVLIYVKFLMWTLNFFTTFVKFCWLSFHLFNSWRVMLWKTLVEWKKQSYATMYAHNSCCLLGFFMNNWFFFFWVLVPFSLNFFVALFRNALDYSQTIQKHLPTLGIFIWSGMWY